MDELVTACADRLCDPTILLTDPASTRNGRAVLDSPRPIGSARGVSSKLTVFDVSQKRMNRIPATAIAWLLPAFMAFMPGCGSDQGGQTGSGTEPPSGREGRLAGRGDTARGGDLDVLRQRGRLRILVPPEGQSRHGPTRPDSLVDYQEEATKFARSLNLRPELIPVTAFGELVPQLLEGSGDIIAANLRRTREHRDQIAFSVPLDHVQEPLLTRPNAPIEQPGQLAAPSLSMETPTSFRHCAELLRSRHAESDQAPALAETGNVVEMASVEIGPDSDETDPFLDFRDGGGAGFDISSERTVAWGVRPDAPQLLAALNRFLHREHLAREVREIHLGDLPSIRKRKVLRVLLRNNASAYFLWRGELLGFEYELASEFARHQGLRLQVVVPPNHESMLSWLLEGRADVAAGFLTPTQARQAKGVVFSRPYHYASELVVTRSHDQSLEGPEDLAGRTLVVRRSSAYWSTIETLQRSGIALHLVAAPEDMETEDIIGKVASGEYDLTVADSHILDIELTWRDDIKSAFPLGHKVPHGWALRPDNPELLTAINDFFNKEYRGLFYNVTYRKYFKNSRRIKAHVAQRVARSGALSPYDALVRKYADIYGFDWRLIVAQMYQESRFDPNAISWAGAVGLMQVMPRTAEEMDFEDLRDPEEGIHAGVKYLSWVRDRFPAQLPVSDRMWFALASYNAGVGHVRDARRLAIQKGWDGNRWFDNVERAMLLLSRPKYAVRAAHGYVRGREPVRYVRQIRDRFKAYVRLTNGRMALQTETPGVVPTVPEPSG